MIGRAASLASASVTAGLAIARRILAAPPKAAQAIVGFVRQPPRESGWPDEPAVKVDAPIRPRRARSERETGRSDPARTQDPDAAAALLADPHIEADEPELVATIAEDGAEKGPGPELNVVEPWEGYRQLTAPELLKRLQDATAEEAAAIQLYESVHKKRRSILDAASRRIETSART
jgi:hypothetical protein